jgi:hypothetical protein
MIFDNFTYSIAIHEAGHAVAGAHFKIPAYPEILDEGRSAVTQTTYANYAGMCSYDEGGIPKFQFAVICWCGPLAQCVFGTPPEWAPPYKPTARLLRDWWAAMLVQIKKFSAGDRAGILGDYKRSWRACKLAYRITKMSEARIIRLAKALADGRNPKPPVPMPDSFPATFGDFMERIIGGSDPEAKFAALVRAQAERFFVDSQLTFATPEQREQAMLSWTAARMEHWQNGFADVDSWQDAARAFRAWTKTAKQSTD